MNIIFHIPIPLDINAKSASGIRPLKILETFKLLGYNVDVIAGYVAERRCKIKEIKQKIKMGLKYDFCYSESSTMPTLLTEKNHLPILISPDFKFFRFCKKNKIPIKLFYRDIYWCFPEYYKNVGLKGYIAKFFYKYDVNQYLKYLDTLYVPCLKMLDYIPSLKTIHIEELPSGCSIISRDEQSDCDSLNLIYVGGIGNHYNLSRMIEGISDFRVVKLFLCVRENDWNNVKSNYDLHENILLKHICGNELIDIYNKTNISMLFVEPSIYREFAIPYKLFEYIGFGIPIIASEGTAVGDYVSKYDIGWTIPYTKEAFIDLLNLLLSDKSLINQKINNIKEHSKQNTWECRCKQIMGKLK